MNLLLARCVPSSFNDRCLAIRDYVRTEDVQHLLGPIREHAKQPGHTLICAVSNWMCMALNVHRTLRYIPDPKGCDFWSRPAVTLQRRGGDCDDLGILNGTLCRALGLYAEFVVGMLSHNGVERGVHLWVEGQDARGRFFFMEATTGQHMHVRPADYKPYYFLAPEGCRYPPGDGPPGGGPSSCYTC